MQIEVVLQSIYEILSGVYMQIFKIPLYCVYRNLCLMFFKIKILFILYTGEIFRFHVS